MSAARSARRAAERQALKAARQPGSETISPAQLAANRANAQLSSGPSSPEGKLKVSHNALKTGLTGRTILLPSDDVAAYQSLVALINQKFNPGNDLEKHLPQSIADTEWRLLRIPTLEAGLYALGRNELAADCPDPSVLEALIFRTYQKDLRNLALQERRLRNQLKEDTAELCRLQQERQEAQTAAAPKEQPVPNGFEFSTPPEARGRSPLSPPATPSTVSDASVVDRADRPLALQPDSMNSKGEAIAA
jgi:hypothetical protein